MTTENMKKIKLRDRKRTLLKIKRRREVHKHLLICSFSIVFILTVLFFATISINASNTNKNSQYKYYTCIEVGYGDSLNSIAQRYIDDNYSSLEKYVSEVKSINHIKEEECISAGQSLVVPYYSSIYK